jgi:predicted small metal-binding protein
MVYTFVCRDTGVDCPYVTRGETVEELWEEVGKHVEEVHGHTDEQLNAPKFQEEAKALIQQT